MKHFTIGLLVLALAAVSGCTRAHHREKADKETYRLIARKAAEVPGMTPDFDIEQNQTPPLEGLPQSSSDLDFLGEAGASEQGAQVISFEKALHLAVTHSRQYQNQKELLYLQALGLTLEKHAFDPIFAGQITGAYERTTTDITKLPNSARLAQAIPGWMGSAATMSNSALGTAAGITGLASLLPAGVVPAPIAGGLQTFGSLAGSPSQLLQSYSNVVNQAFTVAGVNQPRQEIMDERDLRGTTTLAASILLKGGTEIAASITSDFLRYLTGDPRITTTSVLTGSITQPLLRGRGSKVVAEALTQSERNLLYQLRTFTRFRKTFVVDVTNAYYRVLQARDTARNNYLGYRAFLTSLERDRYLAEEGRITQSDLGRSEQATLDAEDRWFNAVRDYKERLDDFKILLGLSTDAHVVLDDVELEILKEESIQPSPTRSPEDAVKVALAARLDLYTVRDQKDDAIRREGVAANALKPDLDLIVEGRVDSEPGMDMFNQLDWRRARWSAGFGLDLPLDRKQERNNYRASLIDVERAYRELELATDNVKLDVRNAWRDLEQAERTYKIRGIGVEVNERRVEEQDLLAEYGRATALNQIDAQNDLVNSQNALTAALVNHTIARLSLWRDMGILFIKEDGQWQEVTDDG